MLALSTTQQRAVTLLVTFLQQEGNMQSARMWLVARQLKHLLTRLAATGRRGDGTWRHRRLLWSLDLPKTIGIRLDQHTCGVHHDQG